MLIGPPRAKGGTKKMEFMSVEDQPSTMENPTGRLCGDIGVSSLQETERTGRDLGKRRHREDLSVKKGTYLTQLKNVDSGSAENLGSEQGRRQKGER